MSRGGNFPANYRMKVVNSSTEQISDSYASSILSKSSFSDSGSVMDTETRNMLPVSHEVQPADSSQPLEKPMSEEGSLMILADPLDKQIKMQ